MTKIEQRIKKAKKKKFEIKPINTEVGNTEDKKIFYAVMRLNERFKVNDVFGKSVEVNVKKGGIEGYIPVFNNYDDAVNETSNGKYQIIAITPDEN